MNLLTPALRALEQFDDPAFLGVVLRSVALSLLCFVALAVGITIALEQAAAGQDWLAWIAGLLGGATAIILAVLLLLPLASIIATLFVDRVADAVERRFYPSLPPAHPAPMAEQVWDAVALGLRVLLAQAVALVLAVLIPGVGAILGWAISAWAFGRGLFVAVAMRRMSRADAEALYRQLRGDVLGQGALITAGMLLPLLNLFVPVLGTAALVHVLHGPVRR